MWRLSNSPIAMGYNCFWFFTGLQAAISLFCFLGLDKVAGILWFLVSDQVLPLVEPRRIRNLRVIGVLICLTGNAQWIPLFGLIMIGLEQNTLFTPNVRKVLVDAEITVEKYLVAPAVNAGANSTLGQGLEGVFVTGHRLWAEWHETGCAGYGFISHATKIRENGLANYVRDLDHHDALFPGEVLHKEKEVVSVTKWMGIIGTLCLALLFRAGTMGVTFFVIAMMMQVWDNGKEKFSIMMNGKMSLSDGTYQITRKFFGIPINTCIGVVYEGTMHAPYHGVAKSTLLIGKTVLNPYFISIDADVTTWGGMPKIGRVSNGDEIFINCENENSRRTYRSRALVDMDGSFSWPGTTEPGESGSGIWKKCGEELVLVGLAGRWASDEGKRTEAFIRPELVADDVKVTKGEVIDITMHPGAGKTWRIVPKLVRDFMVNNKGGRVMVVGPTRIVAKEIYCSLKRMWPNNVGLNIKGEKEHRDAVARIQVTTHHSFINMVHKAAREVINMGLLIIDEAHMDDAATKLCNIYASNAAEAGMACVRMSATLGASYNKDSNYPICDHRIKEGQEFNVIRDKINEGKRVLWFVSGSSGETGCKALAKRLTSEGIPALALSRETFEETYPKLGDLNYKVIVSTNIAECGMNIDVDVVVNTAREFSYIANGDNVYGERIRVDKASWIQRRGRIGRKKPGEHYYTDDPREVVIVKASDYDANILAQGRSWNRRPMQAPCQLTDEQFAIWLDKGLPPRFIDLKYGPRGKLKGKENLEKSIAMWLSGGSQECCKCGYCPRSAQWFDMRVHDDLVALQNDGADKVGDLQRVFL